MALLFATYGILAGLVVRKHDFFPANVINVEIFMWEAEYKIEKLTKQQLISQERRKLGHELHDRVIQNIFVAGLAVESLIENEDEKKSEELMNIKQTLNEVISEIRGFISKSTMENFSIGEFRNKIVDLVTSLQKISRLNITLNYQVSEITLGHLAPQKLEQIYYIIQEAISNSIKHSEGSKVTIDIISDLKQLNISIRDNGKGIYLKKYNITRNTVD